MHSTSKAGDVVYLISNRRLSETCFNLLKSLEKKYLKKLKTHKKENTKICVCGEVGSDLRPVKGCAQCHHRGETPHASTDECLLFSLFFLSRFGVFTLRTHVLQHE